MSQALWISQTTSYPQTTMEFHFYRLYWETPIILQVWHYLGYNWPAHQAGDLYSCPWHYHICRLSMFICSPCVFQTWYSFLCHLQQRLGVCIKLLHFKETLILSLSLGTALNIWLHFTSGYHPKGDGQTKHTNQTLEWYLCVYCNYQQGNWSKILSLMKFTYNNALSATTGVSLFFTNKRYHPNIIIYPEHNIAFFWACDFAIDLYELQSILKAEISVTQQHYQRSADVWHSPTLDFKVGDKVFIKT